MMNEQIGLREFISEFFGSLVLVFFACGVVAAGVFFNAWNSFIELAVVTGLGVTAGIYVAGPDSQAHLNPAVTFALAVWQKFPPAKVLPYILAQISGSFSGSMLTYILYKPNLAIYHNSTGAAVLPQFFYTSAAPQLSHFQAMLVEILLTLILTLMIFAVTDLKNQTIPKGAAGALAIGMTVALLGSAFGRLTGFAMNPARDLGPRFFAYLSGWDSAAFPGNYYFLVPLLGPIIGAVLGGLIYEKLLRARTT